MKNIFSTGALVVIAIIAIGGYMSPTVTEKAQDIVVGAFAGPEVTEHIYTLAGSTNCGPGGVVATSTLNAAETLLASNLRNSCVIDYTINNAAVTLTLPASSTMSDIIPRTGMTRTWLIRNATTTSRALTLAGGTGTLLKTASSSVTALSPVIAGDTDGSNFGVLTMTRKSNSDITVLFTSFRD